MAHLQSKVYGIALLAALLAGRFASAQPAPAGEDGSTLHVYVLTFGPGDDPWEKFGHNAIRIVDDADPGPFHDACYNWGYFDFAGKNFIWNFIQGRLIYAMRADRGEPTLEYYRDKLHRDIHQQELNLSNQQKLELRDLLDATNTDANRFYRYDYYRDNCSSRVRDVVDNLIDHRLAKITKGVASGTTFRFHTDRLDTETLWLYVSLQGVLGQPVDRPIDRWEEMFLPEKLHDRLNEVRVYVDGYDRPLVKEDRMLYQSTRPPEPVKPPTMAPRFWLAGIVIGAIFAALGHYARRHWAARWGLVVLSTPWFALIGVGGTIIWWAWAVTDHVVASPNENVMQVSILSLPLLVMLPMLIFGARRGVLLTRALAWTMASISVIGLLLKVLPWFYQVNYSIIGLCLPVNVAIGYAVWAMGRRSAEAIDANLAAAKAKPLATAGRAKA